ncbi:MAG TPA: Gfo/Idh/MocA family oxidoreductase [Phycisphaerae bacterium]|nr:Gfo/Idh/MocA family oxidoreductase [Phycisphaerae bacterium]
MTQGKPDRRSLSRRQFVKTSAVAASAVMAAPYVVRGAAADKPIRFGVIGAGGRGRGACRDAMAAAPDVKLVAAADLSDERLADLRDKMKDLVEVDPKNCFKGPDAYKKVLDMDLDYVILATPPSYRPLHFPAAIEAGKHVFMEKPVAVDPVGIRRMLAAGEMATRKKLCVVAGTQRRHEASYLEVIKRLHEGAIGEIRAMQVYWNQSQLWFKPREAGWSDDDWMHRDWVNWCWLSGDHVVEQHIHNTDIANWVLKAHPIKVNAMGGRHRRVTGDQYDFFVADLTYPGEIHVHSECRQINGCTNNVSERAIGTKGWSDCKGTIALCGSEPQKIKVEGQGAFVQEHADLIAAIRGGQYINETRNVTESTMTNIMIRVSAYTGQEVAWDELMKSDLELKRPDYELTAENIKARIPVPGTAEKK